MRVCRSTLAFGWISLSGHFRSETRIPCPFHVATVEGMLEWIFPSVATEIFPNLEAVYDRCIFHTMFGQFDLIYFMLC